MKYITVKWLKENNACPEALEKFKKEFGEKALAEKVIKRTREAEKPAWETWLLARGVKASVGNYSRRHVLRIVAAKGDLITVKFLVEKDGANINAKKGIALLTAVRKRKIEVVKFLIEKGAIIQDSVIEAAKNKGYEEILKILE